MFLSFKYIFTLQLYRKNLPKWLTVVAINNPGVCFVTGEIYPSGNG